MPTVYVLDGEGVIRYRVAGAPGEELETLIEELVSEAEAETDNSGAARAEQPAALNADN